MVSAIVGILFTAVPMALTGFSTIEFAGVFAIIQVWDLVIHANVNWRLRSLGPIWVTPEYHHWHHVEDREAWDKNYAGAVPTWDLAFGTFYLPKDKRPQSYSIPRGISPRYVDQLAYPFRPAPSTRADA